jgi:neutral ceramidase
MRILISIGLVWLLVGPGFAQQKLDFRAGAYAQDVTPTRLPISVNGYMTDRQATQVFDRLHARALVLDDGQTRLALVICDFCMIPRSITDAAKKLAQARTGIPPQNILIAATHTHTAPTLTPLFQSEPDPDYVRSLPPLIARAIEQAQARLAPARIAWGVGHDPTQVFNRRWKLKPGSEWLRNPFGGFDRVKTNPGYRHPDLVEPAGPVDPEIPLICLQTPEGRPLAVLANYSLHYVGGVPPLSADYFGAYAERLRQLLEADADFVALLSNGTSGDINNVNFAGPPPATQRPGEQMRLVADSVAQASLKVYRQLRYRDWVPLAAAVQELELGVRRPSAQDLAWARQVLAQAQGKKVLTTLPEIYARETLLLAEYPPRVRLLVQALRIGPVGIVANPCETFVEIGLAVKKRSPLQPVFTIELANGYNGYLPTPAQHALGGYETWRARSSYLEVSASERILETELRLLEQLASSVPSKTPAD